MELLVYLVKVNVILALLLTPYAILLRTERFFGLNRWWLMGTAVLAIALPLLPSWGAITMGTSITLPVVQLLTITDTGTSVWSWPSILTALYGMGVCFALYRILRDLRAVQVLKHEQGLAAWSFFGHVVVPEQLVEGREAILRHESVHASEGHSIDVILFRVLHAFNWFNPMWRWALNEVRSVHEHAADAEAKRCYPDYDALLLASNLGVPTASLIHAFHSSNLKTRIKMMNKGPSSRKALLKYLVAIPAILLALTVASDVRSATPLRTTITGEADQKPEFPGGMEALMTYMGKEVTYPEKAKADGAEGTVHVSFVVKSDGSISDVGVKRGVHAELDAEAMRVVKAMPNWKPGTKEGKVVSTEMVLPVAFKLTGE